MSKRVAASIAMLFGAMIWGGGFVFQKMAMEFMGPFTLGCVRFFIGTLVLVPLLFIKKLQPDPATDPPFKSYLVGGLIAGVFLFLGVTFQQFGLLQTTAGKGGFVTALYIILVPFFVWLVFRRKISPIMWVLVIVALIGIFLLCVTKNGERFSINSGDILVLAGSFCWAGQIIALERFGQKHDSIKLSIVQFLVCSFLSAIPMFALEAPTFQSLADGWWSLFYCGALSVGLAFTAQAICLKHADAIVATLIMSMESVFSVIFGFLILHEVLSGRQLFGCILVFVAVVLSELWPQILKQRKAL